MEAEKLMENWNGLKKIINDNFSDERKKGLESLYEFLEERMMYAPASGLEHYHNAFPGGYVDHVLRVCECANRICKQWEEMGATINFSNEELMFSALNHDLGKIGDLTEDYYKPNESEWHRKNQGKIYEGNKNIVHMPVPHRSLWMLQEFGVKVTQNEYIAIMTHDGIYDVGNETYLKTYLPERSLKTNLPIILHHADHMASRIEFDMWKSEQPSQADKKSFKKSSNNKTKTKISTSNKNINATKLFDDLFKE
tara:strand:+ start:1730 stop:2488 length:759 start_codon:yes stop_codon:yes gene_type:complete